MPFGVDRLDREVVQVTDDTRLCDAVGEHLLPVGDLRGAAEPGVQALPRDSEQELGIEVVQLGGGVRVPGEDGCEVLLLRHDGDG